MVLRYRLDRSVDIHHGVRSSAIIVTFRHRLVSKAIYHEYLRTIAFVSTISDKKIEWRDAKWNGFNDSIVAECVSFEQVLQAFLGHLSHLEQLSLDEACMSTRDFVIFPSTLVCVCRRLIASLAPHLMTSVKAHKSLWRGELFNCTLAPLVCVHAMWSACLTLPTVWWSGHWWQAK